MLFVMRHAKAGERRDVGDDTSRPLSKAGWIQANALVDPLVDAGAGTVLLSSPFLRCRQTLEPLAAKLDVAVVSYACLGEAQPLEGMLELIAGQPDGTVLCSHGDMIPDSLSALQRRGCLFIGEPNWKKASVWVLDRDASGNVTTAHCWPPPQ